MPRHTPLYEWTAQVATRFPDLPAAHARSLGEWSYGMAVAHAVHLTAVVLQLAALLHQQVNTVRQRLRELFQPGDRKAGDHRTTFDPHACCGPLVRWITGGWADKRVALALDASNLGDRFTVLAAAVAYRGVGIPVAWRVLPGGQPGESWNDIWVALVQRVTAALGDGWRVFVLTDRGLESATLFRKLVTAGCHPLMRAKAGGQFRPAGWRRFRPMGEFAAKDGDRFAGRGTAYKASKEPLACTLLACRVPGCADPWLILTDLPPAAADPCWYAFRSWIEQGFRLVKRGGWQWQRTRMSDPTRVERVWAAVAVATVWVVEVGGLAEHEERAETRPPVPTKVEEPPKAKRPAKANVVRPRNRPGSARTHRVFTRGLAAVMAGLLNGQVRRGRFVPEPWPDVVPIPRVTEADFDARE
jgi:hypothetical protein